MEVSMAVAVEVEAVTVVLGPGYKERSARPEGWDG